MTPRLSLRAHAREIYDAMAGRDPPSQSSAETSLTARARALYEDSAVPVAEIAALCGVTERTIYKYAAKENWTKRYRRAPDFAAAKGAGGRFIARADKDKPFARGLKATDPQGRARAVAACATAARLSEEAQAKAIAHRRAEQRIICIDALNAMLADYNAYLRERAERLRPPRKKEPAAKVGKYDRLVGSAYPHYSARAEPPKHPAGKARPARAEISPLDIKLEAAYVHLVETALGHWQALQD